MQSPTVRFLPGPEPELPVLYISCRWHHAAHGPPVGLCDAGAEPRCAPVLLLPQHPVSVSGSCQSPRLTWNLHPPGSASGAGKAAAPGLYPAPFSEQSAFWVGSCHGRCRRCAPLMLSGPCVCPLCSRWTWALPTWWLLWVVLL